MAQVGHVYEVRHVAVRIVPSQYGYAIEFSICNRCEPEFVVGSLIEFYIASYARLIEMAWWLIYQLNKMEEE